MSSEEIEITIGKDGNVQIMVRGVNGPTCLDLTRDLETALGGKVVLREMTAEAGEQVESSRSQVTNTRRLRVKRTR